MYDDACIFVYRTFQGALERTLLAIVTPPAEFYSKMLYKAMKGVGMYAYMAALRHNRHCRRHECAHLHDVHAC